ncbi:ATP-binding protein [Cognatishimia maritima]|uniref:histidine kinase n=1 Tax=Cognatishimia maritima TaxID=870908 RepID=A0A1M5NFQ3_9RHOB|nr:ATP-binding protein [Cognatishimia maritima]SHG88029.1 CHASE domain-containing protein [Cognatishimia maritima]
MNRLRGRWAWAASYFMAAAVIILITATTWVLYEREARIVEIEKMRASVKSEIDMIAQGIENAILRDSLAIDALATHISLHPDVDKEEFRAFARRTFSHIPEFKLVALAPDLVVADVFPFEGNQAVIGSNYNEIPAQLAAVKRAMAADNVVIAGPVDLIQGGQALIARRAVKTTDFGAFGPRDWGIVSMVIDLDTILENVGAYDVDFDLALRGKDGLGSGGGIIRGSPSLFAHDPVTVDVDLPYGSWFIGAVPKDGWTVSHVTFLSPRLGFLLSAMALIILVWGVMRLVQLRMRADAKLTAAMNSINDGFAYYDRDDRLVLCNTKYKEMYSLSAEAMVPGATFEEIIRFGIEHKQYSEAIGRESQFLRERLAAHKAGGVNIEQQLDDGRWLKIVEAKTPDGGTVGFRVDITELKNARDEAEAANRAKSEFLDVMSHELRTPLTVVLGGTPFLCRPELLPAATKLFSTLEAKGAEAEDIKLEVEALLASLKSLAGKVDRSAKHLLTLINDVLDFSKIEAGRMDLSQEPINLAHLVEDLIEEFSLKAESKSLYLESEVGDIFVEADELRLRQVFINILGNAFKFTDEGGIRISADDRGARVHVTVSDTGCGIPAAHLNQVFNKFSQVDSSSTRKAGGTGLGMAITKKIVEMHGGDIWVESEEGAGSSFTFTLQRADAKRVANDEPAQIPKRA